MAEQGFGDNKTTDWGGKQVVVDDRFKQTLTDSAAQYNKATGQNLTAEQYDRQINPTTAGARWGDTPPPAAPAGGGATNGGGLLTSTQPGTVTSRPAPGSTTSSSGYKPTEQKVTPESLVQNQVAAITSTGSKLNEAAEARSMQQANRRGLLNSSIAAEAGQKAVLDSAMPIAQQDAGTYASANAANAQYANAASQFAAQAALQKELARLQSDTTMSVADKQLASQQLIARNENMNKLTLAQMDADTRKLIQTLDNDSKLKLSQVEADNRQLLQTNISAANAYAQYAQALSQISTSDKMDAGAKQQAADNQLQSLQALLRSIGQVSGLDLSKYWQSTTSMSNQTGADAPKPPPTGGGRGGIGGLIDSVTF